MLASSDCPLGRFLLFHTLLPFFEKRKRARASPWTFMLPSCERHRVKKKTARAIVCGASSYLCFFREMSSDGLFRLGNESKNEETIARQICRKQVAVCAQGMPLVSCRPPIVSALNRYLSANHSTSHPPEQKRLQSKPACSARRTHATPS